MNELEKLAKEKTTMIWLIMSFDELNKTEKQIVLGLNPTDYNSGKTKVYLYDELTSFYIQLMESYQNESVQDMFVTVNEDEVDNSITTYNTFYVIESKNGEKHIFSIDNYNTFDMNILFGSDDRIVQNVYDVSYEFKTTRGY